MAGAVERAYPGSPIASSGSRIIAAPFQFVTTGTEALRVTVVNTQTNVRVQVHARILRPAGVIDPQAWDHVPTTDRTASSSDFDLGAGALLTLTVVATTAAPLIGQTYVMVKLVQGVGAAAIVLGTLLAGYVTTTQALGWPGSPIADSISGGGYVRAVTGTTPAVGVDWAETVPARARWELLSLRAFLTTAAGGANRKVQLALQTTGSQAITIPSVSSQTPASNAIWCWAPNAPVVVDAVEQNFLGPTPQPCYLLAAAVFLAHTLAMGAADQWQFVEYSVREWLEVT